MVMLSVSGKERLEGDTALLQRYFMFCSQKQYSVLPSLKHLFTSPFPLFQSRFTFPQN